jgi:MFS family permease
VPDSLILRLVGPRALNTFGRAVIYSTVLWELYERTGDKLVVAAVGAVLVIPVVLLFVPSGTLVDRGDRRALATAAAFTTGLVGIGLAIASYLDAHVSVFLVLLLVQGGVTSIHAPASSSLIPMLLPRDELQRANRIGSSLQELAAIAGPSLSGAALAVMDPHWIYAWVALTGLASAVMYRSLPSPRVAAVGPAADRRDWRVGLRFIFRSPLLLPALTLDMFAVLFAGVTALLPVIAKDILHAGPFAYGVLRAAQSAGAVSMAVLAGRLPAWKRPGRVLLVVVALFGVVTIAFGLSTSVPLSVALLFVAGALDNISVVIRLTLEQIVVPDQIRGRVSAVHYVFIGMSNELGAAESGVAAWAIGTIPAIVVGGAVAIAVVGVVAVKWRALAAMPPLAELGPEQQ